MSNFLQLCQKYQKITGITGAPIPAIANQSGMNEKITIWIADADVNIQTMYQDWAFLKTDTTITLNSGQDEYTLASLGLTDVNAWSKDNFVINPGTNSYKHLSWFPYEKWLKSSSRLGVKTNLEPNKVVAKPNKSLVFIDVPDATYTVWAQYYKSPTRMTADTSTSDIPVQFENIILYRAKMYHAEYYEDINLYNSAKADFDRELIKLLGSEMDDQNIRTMGASDPEDSVVVPV